MYPIRSLVCIKAFLIAGAIVLISTNSSAQHHAHVTRSTQEAVLIEGVGAQNHAVSTKSPDAQRFFNQGLAFVYAFNHDEAAASFRKAASLDPNLAMAYWGVALALGPNYNIPEVDQDSLKAASQSLQKAVVLSSTASNRERDYIEALTKRFVAGSDGRYQQLGEQYSAAMRELSRKYPDDPDAAVLYVESLMDLRPWRLWDNNGTPAKGTDEMMQVLESTLRRFPRHVGANHFYIHVLEASPFPEKALPSAKRIAALAPSAGHLVHMPSHIYLRTGDFQLAAKSNQEAIAADQKYFKARGTEGTYPLMYYSHNLHFLAAAQMMQGRFADSNQAARELQQHLLQHAAEFQTLQAQTALPLLVAARFGRWQEILNAPKPPANLPLNVAIWRFAQGLAKAGTGRLEEAAEDLRLTALFVTAAPPDSSIGMNKTTDVLQINHYVLAGRIASAKGDYTQAAEHFQKAVAIQDRLNYDEPSNYFYPVRESLGGALLRSGNAAGAEAIFLEDLKRNPGNGRSLFGLSEALKAQKKPEAEKRTQEFKRAWQYADSPLKVSDL